ncbi:hypothetical protein FRUB_06245 [Fimbriiglobus ruber]|uniref:BIG2 domain-containing protein n=2 Tax=Fimbriiglobus ruber TaxID=1908690 RepID=A0A225DDU9_9BACT|nr:hypothetical protein FRUB_06245 [Fimbriiglobus ruber]
MNVTAARARAGSEFHVSPTAITLTGNYARAQIQVTAGTGERADDLTDRATFRSSDTRIVTVAPGGQLLTVGNGSATVTAEVGGVSKSLTVTVAGVSDQSAIGFVEYVMPVLSKAGCNAGACHASQYGKGGFKLSVFGFAPNDDYAAIVRDSFGRRASVHTPAESLVLQKPTGAVPHAGGVRLAEGSVDYQIIERWLANGAPRPSGKPPELKALRVTPEHRVGTLGYGQQLRVEATYADGRTVDVTHWTKFDSRDESVLSVTPAGMVKTVGKGQGVAMARFEGHAAIATFVVPGVPAVDLAGWTDDNIIDKLAAAKFREVGVSPSGLCDDATFIRRAMLDATGTLPTAEQARAFLDSRDPAKRTKLVDRLLGLTGDPNQNIHDNDYAAYWALKWSDLIRSNSASIGAQGMWALHNWLKESFRENKPFDKIVRELVTAKGSTFSNGPANYFKIANNPSDLTEATSQLFLGVRLQCAKCHNHPYEPLTQADYYSFAAFFARVGNKASQEFGIFGGETVIMGRADGEVSHPRTGAIMPPTPLGGKPVGTVPDRRQALADWLTAKDNSYFARNIVNRTVAALLGRGLVEPVDDLRPTNPATNPELMDALATEFARGGFDQKKLFRLIMTSRLYQLDSRPTKANAADDKFYSHYHVKRVPAEVLLDAIDQATGTRTKFEKVPLGTRAIELPDARYNNYFLNTFGKPRREAVCECERVSEPNLAQALHTLNGETIEAKIADLKGTVATLLAAKKPAAEIVDELYLATLSRRATAAEQAAAAKLLAEAGDPKAFYQDLLWSLLNSKYFQFTN